MESLLSANEDILIPPLSLGLKPGAAYIQNRRQASVFSSINQASPQGVQNIRFNLSSTVEWCDPASVIISFDCVNDSDTAPLHPATVGAHCLFERYQCKMAASSIEDIEHYGRTCELFTQLIPAEKRLNEGMLGFGTKPATVAFANEAAPTNAEVVAALKSINSNDPFKGNHQVEEIPAGGKRKVYMKLPLSGIFTAQQKYLPLWSLGAGGVEVMLSLAPAADAVTSNYGGVAKSTTYHLENIVMQADMITIDTALQEQYSRNLMEGGSLMLHTKLWDCTLMYLPTQNGGNFDVSLAKSLSRLATAFFSFSEELTDAQIAAGEQYVNTFRMYDAAKENIESHVTIGSKRFPEFAVKGVAGHFWRLVSALGIAKSLPHSVNVDVEGYKTNSFCIATDFEATPMVASSGVNTQGGQEIALHVKSMIGADGTQPNLLRRCYACLHYEAIVELRATGASLLT